MKKFLTLVALLLALTALTFATTTKKSQNHDADDKTQAVRITKGPVIEYADDKSAVIAWSTNVPGGTTILYGTSPGQLTQSAKAPWGGLTHRVHINNLQPNTTYYFRVDTGAAAGTGGEASSNVESFHTTTKGQKAEHYPGAGPR